LVTALDTRLQQNPNALPGVGSIEVLVPKGALRQVPWKHIKIRRVGRLSGHAWEQLNLAWASRDGLLLNLTSCGPLLHNTAILVMHDAAVFVHPAHFSKSYGLWHRFLRPRLARKARKLITISEFSRRELSHWCKVPPEAFTIIGDSAEHMAHTVPDVGILTRFGLQNGRYALTVGNQSPNKNIALAIEAFERAAPQGWLLAVAGGGSDKIFGATRTADAANVKRLGRVTDAELRALYENAGLFLFPSRYEGFGVPPLEAMTLGCPVLSSHSSAMPEILGDAVMYFDPNDAQDLSNKITVMTKSDIKRSKYSSAGKYYAKNKYSWEISAAVLLKTLVEIVPLVNVEKS